MTGNRINTFKTIATTEQGIKKIVSCGYEFTLIYADRSGYKGIEEPAAFGFPGFALRSCRKIKKKKEAKNE